MLLLGGGSILLMIGCFVTIQYTRKREQHERLEAANYIPADLDNVFRFQIDDESGNEAVYDYAFDVNEQFRSFSESDSNERNYYDTVDPSPNN